jgi:hypothetical protein
VEVITTPVTHDVLAAAQDDNDELQTLLVSNTTLQLEKLHIPGTSVELYCNTSAGKPRTYVPSHLRCQIFNSLHSLSHPRIKAMAKTSPSTLCDQPFKKTAALGPKLANPASAPKCLATPSLQLATSSSLLLAFYTSTLI